MDGWDEVKRLMYTIENTALTHAAVSGPDSDMWRKCDRKSLKCHTESKTVMLRLSAQFGVTLIAAAEGAVMFYRTLIVSMSSTSQHLLQLQPLVNGASDGYKPQPSYCLHLSLETPEPQKRPDGSKVPTCFTALCCISSGRCCSRSHSHH